VFVATLLKRDAGQESTAWATATGLQAHALDPALANTKPIPIGRPAMWLIAVEFGFCELWVPNYAAVFLTLAVTARLISSFPDWRGRVNRPALYAIAQMKQGHGSEPCLCARWDKTEGISVGFAGAFFSTFWI
jgi:hypothetical protein